GGTGATVLIASGNPLGSPAYSSPTAANAWTITLEGDGTRYDPAKGKAVSLAIDPASEWPFIRSVASSARIGDGILVAGGVRTFVKVAGFEDCKDSQGGGGVRTFVKVAGFEDCKDSQGKELDYCFPRSFAVVTPGADGGVGAVEAVRLPHGRLGVTAVALDRDQVLLLGGIAGFGDNPPADYDWKPPDAPSEWKTSSWVLSSALIAVRAGAFSDDACAAHPPAAPAE
ncbi:MAG: hypothetical protein FJ087_15195, partial [Deltaproteobacteria bacterium]|nr:hypothetical protein [Deltaproteobacteria bacterium]